MKIHRPRPGTLQLTKSRTMAALHVASFTLVAGAWYSFLFTNTDIFANLNTLFVLLLWLAPLYAVPQLLRHLRLLAAGETFTLNQDSGIIERNDVQLAHFSDVERVQIRAIYDSEGSDEYRLSIVLKNQEKIRIDQSTDEQDIAAAAEDIADIIGVNVTSKGRRGGDFDLPFTTLKLR